MPHIHLLGAPLDPVTLDDAVAHVDEAVASRRPTLDASLNAAKLVGIPDRRRAARVDRALRPCHRDGVPVVWAARALGHPVPGT